MAEKANRWSLLIKYLDDGNVRIFKDEMLVLAVDRLEECQARLGRRGLGTTTLLNRDPCTYHYHPDKPVGYACTKDEDT